MELVIDQVSKSYGSKQVLKGLETKSANLYNFTEHMTAVMKIFLFL
ncbi:hypothetical protein [Bacillus sp. FJAT-52991]|uniref:ABC transporter ATP-binding protein n=1 Tax=Bacillus kandeliae TaxID=3129297 RepID=A0ABZ2N635_9BACI